MADLNPINDPANPAFVPWMERKGSAAKGVTEAWAANASRNLDDMMADVRPEDRQAIGNFLAAQYNRDRDAMMRYEEREVRQGRLDEMEETLSLQQQNVAASILAQHDSLAADRDRTMDNARKTVEELSRQEGHDKAYADEWLAMNAETEDAVYAAGLGDLIRQTHSKMADVECVIDNAVAQGLISPEEGAARKRKGARATYMTVFNALAQQGHADAAEAFAAALRPVPRTRKAKDAETGEETDEPVLDEHGLPVMDPNSAATLYGIRPDEIAGMEDAVARVRARREAAAKQAEYDARKEREKVWNDEIANERMAVLDDETVLASSVTVADFRKRLDADSALDPQTKARMVSDIASIVKYREAYKDAIKRHEAAVKKEQDKAKAALLKEASEHGFFAKVPQPDGTVKWKFQPATAFPKDTSPYAYERFAIESPVWNDLPAAIAELEAAKMTGEMSRTFYESRLALIRANQDEVTKTAWLAVMPDIIAYAKAGGGKDNDSLSAEEKIYRKSHEVITDIWAKSGKEGSPTDWVKDALKHGKDEADTEEAVSAELLLKTFQAVERLARKGVDTREAIRQYIAPTIQLGYLQRLEDRVRDPAFADEILRKHYDEMHVGRAVEALIGERLKAQDRHLPRVEDENDSAEGGVTDED